MAKTIASGVGMTNAWLPQQVLLRDRQVPAWQRLQAAGALMAHHNLRLRSEGVDFDAVCKKLKELAGSLRYRPGKPVGLETEDGV